MVTKNNYVIILVGLLALPLKETDTQLPLDHFGEMHTLKVKNLEI